MMNVNEMKAIICRVVPVAGYGVNVCNVTRTELDELDNLVKNIFRKEGFHLKQSSYEKLCGKTEVGGKGLESFQELYDEAKTRVACYMTTANIEWIKTAWENECVKEQVKE